MTTLLDDLKSFVKNRVTTKFSDFKSALGKKKQSNPCSMIGKHLLLTSSRMTSSEATLPIFPKIAFSDRRNERLE